MVLQLWFVLCMSLTYSCYAESTFFSSVNSFINRFSEKVITQEFFDAESIDIIGNIGNITMHTWQQKSVMVEATIKTKNPKDIHTNFILKRGILHLETRPSSENIKYEVDYNIIIPENFDVTAFTKQGNITIKQARGIIKATTEKGNITIYGSKNNVMTRAEKGDISIESTLVPNNTIIQALTHKGNITFKTSEKTAADITAQTKIGKVTSDLLLTLKSKTTKIDHNTWNQQKKELNGFLTNADSGTTIKLMTHNGNIKILPLHI